MEERVVCSFVLAAEDDEAVVEARPQAPRFSLDTARLDHESAAPDHHEPGGTTGSRLGETDVSTKTGWGKEKHECTRSAGGELWRKKRKHDDSRSEDGSSMSGGWEAAGLSFPPQSRDLQRLRRDCDGSEESVLGSSGDNDDSEETVFGSGEDNDDSVDSYGSADVVPVWKQERLVARIGLRPELVLARAGEYLLARSMTVAKGSDVAKGSELSPTEVAVEALLAQCIEMKREQNQYSMLGMTTGASTCELSNGAQTEEACVETLRKELQNLLRESTVSREGDIEVDAEGDDLFVKGEVKLESVDASPAYLPTDEKREIYVKSLEQLVEKLVEDNMNLRTEAVCQKTQGTACSKRKRTWPRKPAQ